MYLCPRNLFADWLLTVTILLTLWITLVLKGPSSSVSWFMTNSALIFSNFIFPSADGNNCTLLSRFHNSLSPLNWYIALFTGDCIYNSAAVDRVKYAYNSGHQIGSHTWAHKDLTTLTWDQSMPYQVLFSPRLETHVFIHLVHDEMWRVEREFSRRIAIPPFPLITTYDTQRPFKGSLGRWWRSCGHHMATTTKWC